MVVSSASACADGTQNTSNAVVVDDLPASILGTKEHWDSVYRRERATFDDTGDIGECWFGDATATRMARWASHRFHIVTPNNDDDNNNNENTSKSISAVDLGCGNGHLLVELASEGFQTLVGLDYSADACELARGVITHELVDRNVSLSPNAIDLQVVDMLDVDAVTNSSLAHRFNIALDKGTFDAICLAGGDAAARARAAYPCAVHALLRLPQQTVDPSIFLITSCNWTEPELITIFESSGLFTFLDRIPYKTFTFGGKQGQQVSTVAFVAVHLPTAQ